MEDRELLELAAKAAGYEVQLWCSHDSKPHFELADGTNAWNPLTDDGDALRLAVALDIEIGTEHRVGVPFKYADHNFQPHCGELAHPDPYAATRRAIVRAAAEIGKEK